MTRLTAGRRAPRASCRERRVKTGGPQSKFIKGVSAMFSRAFCLAVVVAVSLCGAAPARSQTTAPGGLTLEWIYGDEGRRVASVPSHAWTAGGRLLLFDAR